MADKIKRIPVNGVLYPNNDFGYVVKSSDIRGGYTVVTNIGARDTLAKSTEMYPQNAVITTGSVVYTIEEDKCFRYREDGTWSELDYATKDDVRQAITDAISGGTVDLSDYAKKEDIPRRVTELQNDAGYITEIPAEYITETELHDKGYLTEHQDISHLATQADVAAKQDILVSGYNIKTINGKSILGQGNIVIEGTGSGTPVQSVSDLTIDDTNTLSILDVEGNKVGNGVKLTGAHKISAITSPNVVDGSTNVELKLQDFDGNDIGSSCSFKVAGGGGGGGPTSVKCNITSSTLNTSNEVVDSETNTKTYKWNPVSGYSADLLFSFEEATLGGSTGYSGTALVYVDNELVETRTVPHGVVNKIDITKYLTIGISKVIKVVVKTAFDAEGVLVFNTQLIDLRIVSPFNPLEVRNGNFIISYSCVGSGLNKTVHIRAGSNKEIKIENIIDSDASGTKYTETINTARWSHGVHRIDMWLTTAEGYESEHLIYDVIYSVTGVYTPLVTGYCDVDSATYGDTVSFKYVAHTPSNDITENVTRALYVLDNSGIRTEIESHLEISTPSSEQEWLIDLSGVKFPKSGTVYIELSVQGGNTITDTIEVLPFASDYSVDMVSDRLVAYIAPSGQQNSVTNKDSLCVNYKDMNDVVDKIKVEMIDFNYSSNGFLSDSNDTKVIRLNGDSRLRIHLPIFNRQFKGVDGNTLTLNGESTATGRTVEFRFNAHNVTDPDIPFIQYFKGDEYSASRVSGTGFRVFPKHAYFLANNVVEYDNRRFVMTPDTAAVINFTEDSTIRLTFVIEPREQSTSNRCIKIFTNGELNRVLQYTASSFDSGEYIELGSTGCELDLYSAVFYDKALSEHDIIQNYIADTADIEERVALFTANDVKNDYGKRGTPNINDDTMLDYYECRKRVPCALTIGRMSREKGDKTKIGLIYTKPADNEAGFETWYSNTTLVDGKYQCRSNVQGTTSSKLYPRYNYKLKATKKLYLSQQSETDTIGELGEKEFCWKADMMSSDHANTVNARWFQELLDGTGTYIPPAQAQIDSGMSKPTIHPVMYGFRCLLFNAAEDPAINQDTPIYFMGDGCLNNDKGNSDTLGLANDCDTNPSDTYWKDNPVTEYTYTDNGETEVVAVLNNEGVVQSRCQKWEYTDNPPDIDNFKSDRFFETKQELDINGNVVGTYKAVTAALECTYPDQGDLEDWGLEPDYSHMQIMYLWVLKRANFWKFEKGTAEYETKLNIFKNEFSKHFNFNHTATYYLAVMMTALVDNLAKNMFMSTYDTLADKIVFTSSALSAGVTTLKTMMDYAKAHEGDIPEDFIDWEASEFCIWYPTLYDLDSCYGVDNKGHRFIPYYADWNIERSTGADSYRLFNGSESPFWHMFVEAFDQATEGDSIKKVFTKLADSDDTKVTLSDGNPANVLSYNNWFDHMISKNIDTVPVRISTEDLIYKYEMPWLYGYQKEVDDSNKVTGMKTYPSDNQFLYLIQANKRLQDMDFMRQRLNIFFSKYQTKEFVNDDIKIQCSTVLDPENAYLAISPYQTMYCGVKFRSQGAAVVSSDVVEPGETIRFKYQATGADNDFEMAVLGAGNVSELTGLDTFAVKQIPGLSNAKKLKALVVGSASHTNNALAALEVSGNSMLEDINVINCTGLTALDLSKNGLIKNIDARGASSLGSITLPVGGYIESLRLPSSITNITVRNHNRIKEFSITDSVESIDNNYNNINTLYVEGLDTNIPVADIIYNVFSKEVPNIKQLRLYNVSIDASSWEEEDVTNLINIFASDRLSRTYIDSEGRVDTSVEYPEISGIFNIGTYQPATKVVEALTTIMARYPNLQFNLPQRREKFEDYSWFEIKSICRAAQQGATKVEDWFEVGDTKQVRINNTTYTLEIVDMWRYSSPANKKLPLTLWFQSKLGEMVKMFDSAYLTKNILLGDTAIEFNSAGVYEFNVEDETSATFTTTDVSYIESISWVRSESERFTWYLDGRRGTIRNYAALSQEDFNDRVLRELVVFDTIKEWIPTEVSGGQTYEYKKLTIDGTGSTFTFYDSFIPELGLSDTSRILRFEAGVKFIVDDLQEGDKISIKLKPISNYGGYFASKVHQYIENTLYQALPVELQNVISYAHVGATIGGLSPKIEYRDVKMLIPSASDLDVNQHSNYIAETGWNEPFVAITKSEDRKRLLSPTGTSAAQYWTRSASAYSHDSFVGVSSMGSLNKPYANTTGSADVVATNTYYYIVPIINI